jgi:hypothetical protein
MGTAFAVLIVSAVLVVALACLRVSSECSELERQREIERELERTEGKR